MRSTYKSLIFLALLGVACATADKPKMQKPPDEFRLADGTLVVCRMESDTGSNIKERVCRKVEGANAVKQQDLNAVMNKPAVNTRVGN